VLRSVGLPRILAVLLAAVILASTTGCAGEAGAGGAAPPNGAADGVVEAKTPGSAPLPVLAEATTPDTAVTVQVLEAKRATPDTVRVTVAFTGKAAPAQAPAPSPSSSEPPPPPQALFPADTTPAEFCLITTDGSRRLFLLRDAQNQPVVDGSLQPLRPGERRVLQLMFPAPPAQAGRVTVTLWLGKLALRNLPIAENPQIPQIPQTPQTPQVPQVPQNP
jgi:hypothetical protein